MVSNDPLTLERIIAAAFETIRRFGPEKATVIDVARALGVSHAALYRHVPNKAALRDLVVGAWIEETMSPLRKVILLPRPAAERLKLFFEKLMVSKHRRAAEDPELFFAYRTLALESTEYITAHVAELTDLTEAIVIDGIAKGEFRDCDPRATATVLLTALTRFLNPMHAPEWQRPSIRRDFHNVWQLLFEGLRKP